MPLVCDTILEEDVYVVLLSWLATSLAFLVIVCTKGGEKQITFRGSAYTIMSPKGPCLMILRINECIGLADSLCLGSVGKSISRYSLVPNDRHSQKESNVSTLGLCIVPKESPWLYVYSVHRFTQY